MAGKDSQSIEASLQRHCVPLALQLLTGLIRRHPPSQEAILSAVPVIHQMEQITSIKAIPQLAEALLDEIVQESSSGSSTVVDAVKALRKETLERKRQLAMKHRMKALEELGLAAPSNEGTTSKPACMEDLDDETGLCCMVCREGYTFKPGEVLGVYVLCKRLGLPPTSAGFDPQKLISSLAAASGKPSRSLGGSGPGGSELGEDLGITTLTHFNVIHLSCHLEATQAERSKRVPKEEWDSAALRNSQTPCNNFMPVWGPEVSEEVYAHSVGRFWGYLRNSLPQQVLTHADSSTKFRVLVRDLELLLVRFAYEQSFSEETHGGSRTNNLGLIPLNIQMGLFLLDSPFSSAISSASSTATLAAALAAPKSSTPRTPTPLSGQRCHYEHVLTSWLRVAAASLPSQAAVLQISSATAASSSASTTPHLTSSLAPSPNVSPAIKGVSGATHSHTFMLTLSLYLMPLKQWQDLRLSVLTTLLKAALGDNLRVSSSGQTDPAAAFVECRNMLLFFALVDALHRALKESSDTSPSSTSRECSDVIQQHIRVNHLELLENLRTELLTQYETEWTKLENWTEFFDTLELLAPVLSLYPSVEAYVSSLTSSN
eukprot:c11897_g1_i1.p1 GENE.c11897_g1_i1~~c11897_g1_i1.p1  ORF type:complete len:680 (+),score=178.00 c11897_g1_i1:236-2041(+)